MQAITAPQPEGSVRFRPVPAIEPTPTGRTWPRWLLIALAVVAAFLAGALSTRPVDVPVSSDAESTLQWMFEAALTYEATTVDGEFAPPATSKVTLEHIEIVDPYRGPILATVSDADGNLSAYEIIVERKDLDWNVKATQLSE